MQLVHAWVALFTWLVEPPGIPEQTPPNEPEHQQCLVACLARHMITMVTSQKMS